jgi:ABC-2 type transport system ATP-binding protein
MALTAEHLVVIGRGRVLADCTTADFIARHAAYHVRVRSPQATDLAGLLRRSGADVTADGGALRVQGIDTTGVGDLAGAHGLVLHELTLVQSSLEDAFMTLTADSVEYGTVPAGAAR